LLFKAYLPIAVFIIPVVLLCKAPAPTLVLLDTLPAPNPTLTVLKVASEVDDKDPVMIAEPVTVNKHPTSRCPK
jgi:hypothetical protein